MTNIRNRIEKWFEKTAGFIFDHRFKTLFITLIFVAALFSQLPKITIDVSTEGFLHKEDPKLIQYEAFRDQFGREEMVIIALKPNNVFDFEFLKGLKKLHDDLFDNVPYLEDVKSLINARNTRGEKDELIVEDLLENWPESEEALLKVEERALKNPMYSNLLLSEDGKFTTIIIQSQTYSSSADDTDIIGEFDNVSPTMQEGSGQNDTNKTAPTEREYLTDQENGEIVKAVEEIVKRNTFKDTEIYIAGTPVVTHFLKRTMLKDMRKFMAIAIFTIVIFLFITFRRISGIFMPLVVVILSLLSTVGLMAMTGVPLKLPTQILPSFILAVGVGDSVHILVIFFQRFNQTGNKKEAISHALGHSGLAVLMTSITTAGGLLSFSTAAIAPVADLGKFASAGVILALLYTVIFLPALLSIIPLKPKKDKSKKDKEPATDRLLNAIASISINHPGKILLVSSIIIIFSILGATRIIFSHNPLKWLPPTNSARVANEKIDLELKGTSSLEVVIDTKKENGLYDPNLLNRLDKSVVDFDGIETEKFLIGKAWTITTIIKEINQALHGNDPAFYTIPQDKQLIAQEFLLFENSGSDDLEDVTDSQFSKARFTIKVPFIDAISYTGFIKDVSKYFSDQFPDESITVTGMIAIFVQVITSAIISMLKSYGYAIIIITILMIILIGRVRIGLLSMIPNLTPILIMLGIMGWSNMRMDLFSMLVGSIAIGLAVDDTIHFMHNFRRYFEQSGDAADAVIQTFHTAGRAMLVTTCVLSIGFFTFMFADMKNLYNFGLLTGMTISLALLSDYFIAPALMIIVNRKRG